MQQSRSIILEFIASYSTSRHPLQWLTWSGYLWTRWYTAGTIQKNRVRLTAIILVHKTWYYQSQLYQYRYQRQHHQKNSSRWQHIIALNAEATKILREGTEIISCPWPWPRITLKVILSWMSHRPLTLYKVSLRSTEVDFLAKFEVTWLD